MKDKESLILGVSPIISKGLGLKVQLVRLLFILLFVFFPVRAIIFYLLSSLAFVSTEKIYRMVEKNKEEKAYKKKKDTELGLNDWDMKIIEEDDSDIEYMETEDVDREVTSTRMNTRY